MPRNLVCIKPVFFSIPWKRNLFCGKNQHDEISLLAFCFINDFSRAMLSSEVYELAFIKMLNAKKIKRVLKRHAHEKDLDRIVIGVDLGVKGHVGASSLRADSAYEFHYFRSRD
jgi:hypothetical protein